MGIPMEALRNLLNYDPADLAAQLARDGHPGFRADQILDWIYRKRVRSIDDMLNLPRAMREAMGRRFMIGCPAVVRVLGSQDTTRKLLFRLDDGQLVESVLIPASPGSDGDRDGRMTLCVSSQVGCAYGCRFCASGLDGWSRDLSAAEIVGQLLETERATGERVDNVVFMGMGEPLANYGNVLKAVRLLNAPEAVGLGARRITLSTSGLVPQIRRLAREPMQIRLAISLHGATDAVRSRIMPVNRRHPVADLFEACGEWNRHRRQKITFEYILIAGVNDAPGEARRLAGAARRLRAKVNLIPYNTVPGLDWSRPSEAVQEAFLAVLTGAGVQATLRREKGHDIAAACGQLRRQQALPSDPRCSGATGEKSA